MDLMEQRSAFLAAYDEFADALFRHCYYRVPGRERARDILQETFLRTWQYLASGKKVENFKTFLYRVAHNLIIDASRKHTEASLDTLMENGFDVESPDHAHLEQVLDGTYALRLANQLEPAYRQAVLMRHVDDLSPKEIAAILGESENAVSVRIHRGIAQLRKLAGTSS